MPSRSAKQKRTMQAAAHDKAFAKRMEIPQSVARDFYEADKRKARRGTIKQAIAKVRSRR